MQGLFPCGPAASGSSAPNTVCSPVPEPFSVTARTVAVAVPGPLSDEQRIALDRVNERVAAADSLDDLVRFVFEATRPLFPCDRLSVAFVEEDGRRIRSRVVAADYEPLLDRGYAEDLAGSSLRAVIERGEPRLIDDLEAYAREHPASRSTRLILREGVRSSLTCPLAVDGRPAGVLFRSSRRPGAYAEREVGIHLALAERLGQAVEKAWRIEQLEAANRAYTEMLGFVSHELKSPVASMMTDAQLLREGYLGPLAAAQRDKIDGMIRKGHYLLGLVRDYLELARLEGGNVEPQFVEVADVAAAVVEPSIDIVQPQIDGMKMALRRELPAGPVAATCDPSLLRIVAVNLLSNAAKYGRAGGAIRVGLAAEPGAVRFSVWNEGPGFPDADRPKLFRKFSRLDAPELNRRKGTGVGLYTSWRLVQLHGGRIDADSRPGEWAEFIVTLPQPS
jgi:hypothetical protein